VTPFEVRFLIVAGLLHGVGLPVAAAIAPSAPTGRFVAARTPPTEIDIDVSSHELRTTSVVPRSHDGRVGPREADDREPNRDRSPHQPYQPGPLLTAERDAVQPPDEDNSFPTSPDRQDDPFNRPPSRRDVDGIGIPGIGDGTAYLPDNGGARDRPGAPTKAPARTFDPESGTKAVQDEMRKKDSKLGLDFPGRGPIRAAFVGAVYSSGAPDVCNAVFSLSVSPSGKVTDVSLGAFTGGDPQIWAAVRKIAKAELAGVTLVMRGAFSKGANVSVMVKSERKSVSGSGSGWNGGTGADFDITEIGTKDVRSVVAIINPQPVD
jgi:hypothetical protein